MKARKVLTALTGVITLTLMCTGFAGAVEYPVIKGYGPVTPLPKAAIQPDKKLHYKVLFDIKTRAKKPDEVNSGLSHMARFLNVMDSAGVKPDKVDIVGVIHGSAGPAALKNDIYKEKFGVDNPNIKLIKALKKAGAKLYVCGQTLADDNYKHEWINPEIVLTLSALVDVPTFELKGYAYLPF
ncbi:MAG TPA: DsrE family protein [Desulfobaccales bacterium]|nr:DsrE family protein [Desulfobaccales bacterium]